MLSTTAQSSAPASLTKFPGGMAPFTPREIGTSTPVPDQRLYLLDQAPMQPQSRSCVVEEPCMLSGHG